jgi:hypothetical protein
MDDPRDPSLFETFEYQGLFWLPATPERQQPGTVRFSEKTILLEVLGTLVDGIPRILAPGVEVKCVLGVTANGKKLTLHNCVYKPVAWSMTGPGSSMVQAQHLLIGGHYPADVDLHFRSMQVEFANLEEWIFHGPFKDPVCTTHNDGSSSTISEFVMRRPETFDVGPIEATISIGSTLSHFGGGYRQQIRRHITWLGVEPRSERHWQYYDEKIRLLQNLLTLLMGGATFPLRVTLNGTTSHEEIKFFFHSPFGKVTEPVLPVRLLTLFPSIESRFGTVLTQWFNKQEMLESVCELFFGITYNDFLYMRFRFLGLVQALETYCRSVQPGQYLDEEKWEPIAEAMLAAIPKGSLSDDHLNSLRSGRLKYGYQYSLRKQLQHLFKSLEPETVKMVSDKPFEFCEDVVATRNYYTHYTSELELKAFPEVDLYWVCERLRVLLTIVLFREIGLEESLVRQIWVSGTNASPLAEAVRRKYGTL